ncbi:MAG: transcriptional repressor [Deltaproteobacteria bacterium]|nr:transcriptional repressor [Deltaproteobacteria bacterium]
METSSIRKKRDPRWTRFEEFLRSRGLRHSASRGLVVEIFFSNEGSISAEELWLAVKNQVPGIAVSTVYRTLRLLVDSGLARTCEGQGTVHYEPRSKASRDRIICMDCGKVMDLDLPEADLLQERIAMRLGYTVEQRELFMYGRCPACLRRRALAMKNAGRY